MPLGYALAQLARAAQARDADPQNPAARSKLSQWLRTVAGIREGQITPGSRTPVRDTPAWVTTTVLHGGFASGAFEAGGPLLPFEQRLAHALGKPTTPETREHLNIWHLEHGAVLWEHLEAGTFRMSTAEEAAIPVALWLEREGRLEDAAELIATIAPWFDRLRFYPETGNVVTVPPESTCVVDAPTTRSRLLARKTPPDIAAQYAAIHDWTPLYERLCALWVQTVDGPPPSIGPTRRLLGGWPTLPDDPAWEAARAAWIRAYRQQLKQHGSTGRYAHPRSNFQRMAQPLMRATPLASSDAARIRQALAATAQKWGPIGSAERAQRLAARAKAVEQPLYTELAAAAAARLSGLPEGVGVLDVDQLSQPVTLPHGPTSFPLPPTRKRTLALAEQATAEELIERHIIRSAETLARAVVPKVAAAVAAPVSDPTLSRIAAQTYQAFRKRRSVLLYNYASQVQFHELPWTPPMGLHQTDEAQRKVAKELTELALHAFPATPLPNPFLRNIEALTKTSGRRLPLISEIAADIFMGGFSNAWAEAARHSVESLSTAFYGHYYSLPSQPPAGPAGVTAWATQRASEADAGGKGRVARNGAIIEQALILGSTNLATLLFELDLLPFLRREAAALADTSLRSCLQTLDNVCTANPFARLRTIGVAATAARQAAFFLSFVDPAKAKHIVHNAPATGAAAQQTRGGFLDIASGGRFDDRGRSPSGRRLLRWSIGPHWAEDRATPSPAVLPR